MIKIAVCEDEAQMRDLLNRKISHEMEKCGKPFRVRCYANAGDILQSPSQLDMDILLLDINLPGVSGFELARRIRQAGSRCALIFVTAMKEYVFDAFEFQAIDYLCKPVDDQRLKRALERAVAHVEGEKGKRLFVRAAGYCRSIRLADILYCEVINRKLYLHTNNGVVEYYGRLQEVEKQLDRRFVKCHRSYLVNLDYLYEYTDTRITLENGEEVPVSRLRKQDVVKTMLQYMKKSGCESESARACGGKND